MKSLNEARILIAESDRVSGLALRSYLELNGLEAATAQNGEEALGLIHKTHPDLLIIEADMLSRGGVLLQEIQRQEQLKDIPVILVRCEGIDEISNRNNQGVHSAFNKPLWDLRALLNRIAELLRPHITMPQFQVAGATD